MAVHRAFIWGIEIYKKNKCINAIANKLFSIVCSVGSEIEKPAAACAMKYKSICSFEWHWDLLHVPLIFFFFFFLLSLYMTCI